MKNHTNVARLIRAYRDGLQGQVAVWFALIALPLLAVTTYSLDYMAAITERTDLLSSLDDASLAAVLRQNITDEERKAFAENYFKANFDNGNLTDLNIIDAASNRVEIEATIDVPTTLSAALGLGSIRLKESSVSELTQGKVVCFLVLDPDGERSFEVTGGAKLRANDCSVQVNSSHKRAAIVEHGGEADSQGFCVMGGAVGSYTPYLNTECSVVHDPYKHLIAPKRGLVFLKKLSRVNLENQRQIIRGWIFTQAHIVAALNLVMVKAEKL